MYNDPPPTQPHTLSLHDALPIFERGGRALASGGYRFSLLSAFGLRHVHRLQISALPPEIGAKFAGCPATDAIDRKRTRLNSSHLGNSYAVFCLKKTK